MSAQVPEVAVRPAEPSDAAELARLAGLAHAELREERGGAVWARREGAWLVATNWPAALHERAREDVVLLGALDEVVVGGAWLRVEDTEAGPLAVLRGIYVEPGARELAVGEALIAEVLRIARERRCTGVDSFVLPGTREAKNFFEAHGLVARGIVVHRKLEPTTP